MIEGTVNKLVSDGGYGFIQVDGQRKGVFFHHSALHGVRFEHLSEGDQVRCEVRETQRGPTAFRVERVGGGQPARPTGPPAGEYRFYNPYNFVRFLKPPPAPGARPDQDASPAPAQGQFAALAALRDRLPTATAPADPIARTLLGRCPPPPHDRALGLSGRLRCTLTAVTPLFVSDSEAVKSDTPKEREHVEHRSFRFYRHGDRPAIPASSLRGMIRSLFEAATNSCMILMDGRRRLTRHVLPAEGWRLVPGRVIERDGELALELYPGATPLTPDRRPDGAQYAAWVPRYLGRTLRGKQNAPGDTLYAQRVNVRDDLEPFAGEPCWALLQLYQHPRKQFRFYSVVALEKDRKALPRPGRDQIVGRGYLHLTNQNIENKHDERFFFLPEGRTPDVIGLSETVVGEYEHLIRDYQENHREEFRKRVAAGLDPEVPDTRDSDRRKHKSGLSRHVVDGRSRHLTAGTTVYALIGDPNHPRDRTLRLLAPVALPRVFYRDHIDGRLPYAWTGDESAADLPGNLAPCIDAEHLCPACRTFGWVAPPAAQLDEQDQAAYAGRLRFSLGTLIGEARSLPPVALAILSTPKPTTKRFYLARGTGQGYPAAGSDPTWNEQSDNEGWDDPHNFIRGRKFYRHHHPGVQMKEQEYRRANGRTDDQNRTIRDPLASDCRFSFEIDFENLAALELGALLWSLELDGQACHRLGYGKPLGFGSVRLSIDDLQLIDPAARYASAEPDAGRCRVTDRKADYVRVFQEAMAAHYPEGDKGFASLPNISDLLALLSRSPEDLPIHYPRTGQIPDAEGKNFEWFVANTRGPGYVLRGPQEDRGLPLVQKPAR